MVCLEAFGPSTPLWRGRGKSENNIGKSEGFGAPQDATRTAELEAALLVERRRAEQQELEMAAMQELMVKLEGVIQQQAMNAQPDSDRLASLEQALLEKSQDDGGEKVEKLLLAVAREKQRSQEITSQLADCEQRLADKEREAECAVATTLTLEKAESRITELSEELAKEITSRKALEEKLAAVELRLKKAEEIGEMHRAAPRAVGAVWTPPPIAVKKVLPAEQVFYIGSPRDPEDKGDKAEDTESGVWQSVNEGATGGDEKNKPQVNPKGVQKGGDEEEPTKGSMTPMRPCIKPPVVWPSYQVDWRVGPQNLCRLSVGAAKKQLAQQQQALQLVQQQLTQDVPAAVQLAPSRTPRPMVMPPAVEVAVHGASLGRSNSFVAIGGHGSPMVAVTPRAAPLNIATPPMFVGHAIGIGAQHATGARSIGVPYYTVRTH